MSLIRTGKHLTRTWRPFIRRLTKKALAALDRVTEKWAPKYPNSMKRWKDNWDAISPIFKFSATVRKVIYTTNAIESLNSTYRKLNRQRSVFPSDTPLLKALYLDVYKRQEYIYAYRFYHHPNCVKRQNKNTFVPTSSFINTHHWNKCYYNSNDYIYINR